MSLILVTGPTVEPLGLQETKDHLRVDGTDDDALIDALIIGAVRYAEKFTGRFLITQTWDWKIDGFPASSARALLVPKPPLQTVVQITYVDTDGAPQTWAASEYDVDAPGGDLAPRGRIKPAFGEVWPTTRDQMNAATLQITVGYGPAGNVPADIKHAMLLHVGHLYEHRESVIVGLSVMQVPNTTATLLWNYRAAAA
jgi:uncharacterized phiE125 gp8 family phage protein